MHERCTVLKAFPSQSKISAFSDLVFFTRTANNIINILKLIKVTNVDGLLHILVYQLEKVHLFLTGKNKTSVFDGFILISHLFGCYKNENLISSYLLDKVETKPDSIYFMLIVRSYTHIFLKSIVLLF